MSNRIVCTQCAIISRGFVGHCKHVIEAIESTRKDALEECAKYAETALDGAEDVEYQTKLVCKEIAREIRESATR